MSSKDININKNITPIRKFSLSKYSLLKPAVKVVDLSPVSSKKMSYRTN